MIKSMDYAQSLKMFRRVGVDAVGSAGKAEALFVGPLLDLLLGEQVGEGEPLRGGEGAQGSREGGLGGGSRIRKHKGLPCPYGRVAASRNKEGLELGIA